jgi:zinc transport system substrate-binding protein
MQQKIATVLAATFTAASVVSGLSAAATAAEMKVVVTLKPVHALVSQIMAGIATPVLIVDGSASPHTFTLKPSGAKAINEAGVFIRVSESVEPFTRKISEALPKTVQLVTLAEQTGMSLLEQREGGAFEEHADHEEEHAEHAEKAGAHHDEKDEAEHHGKDGHVWLDPNNAKVIVTSVTKVLTETYPSDAEKLKANAAMVLSKIDAMSAEIEAQLEPVKGKPFIVFHDSTQYFEKRFGLSAAGSITVSPDVQPSAKRLTEVRKKIVELGATCVFSEPGFQPKLVAAVTDGTKARSGIIDAEGMALTPGPELYFDLMRGMARSLKGCLQPTS